MADGRIGLAAEAFVYGFPLVFDLQRDFHPLLRRYEPDAVIFDGAYELPPITKLTS